MSTRMTLQTYEKQLVKFIDTYGHIYGHIDLHSAARQQGLNGSKMEIASACS